MTTLRRIIMESAALAGTSSSPSPVVDWNTLGIDAQVKKKKKRDDHEHSSRREGDDESSGGRSESDGDRNKERKTPHESCSSDSDDVGEANKRETPSGPNSPSTPSSRASGGYRDRNDYVCAICEKEGDLLLCDGPCLQSFHIKCLGLTELPDDDEWFCDGCRSGVHECFECKHKGRTDMGSADMRGTGMDNVATGSILHICRASSCGKYYHLKCVKALPLTRELGDAAFICPLHTCAACQQSGGSKKTVRCTRCPTSYHSKCIRGKRNIRRLMDKRIICAAHLTDKRGSSVSSTGQLRDNPNGTTGPENESLSPGSDYTKLESSGDAQGNDLKVNTPAPTGSFDDDATGGEGQNLAEEITTSVPVDVGPTGGAVPVQITQKHQAANAANHPKDAVDATQYEVVGQQREGHNDDSDRPHIVGNGGELSTPEIEVSKSESSPSKKHRKKKKKNKAKKRKRDSMHSGASASDSDGVSGAAGSDRKASNRLHSVALGDDAVISNPASDDIATSKASQQASATRIKGSGPALESEGIVHGNNPDHETNPPQIEDSGSSKQFENIAHAVERDTYEMKGGVHPSQDALFDSVPRQAGSGSSESYFLQEAEQSIPRALEILQQSTAMIDESSRFSSSNKQREISIPLDSGAMTEGLACTKTENSNAAFALMLLPALNEPKALSSAEEKVSQDVSGEVEVAAPSQSLAQSTDVVLVESMDSPSDSYLCETVSESKYPKESSRSEDPLPSPTDNFTAAVSTNTKQSDSALVNEVTASQGNLASRPLADNAAFDESDSESQAKISDKKEKKKSRKVTEFGDDDPLGPLFRVGSRAAAAAAAAANSKLLARNGKKEPQKGRNLMKAATGRKSSDDVAGGTDDDVEENWVQCDSCQKWRRLPLFVNVEKLPAKWFCRMNEWDNIHNSCQSPEESVKASPEKASQGFGKAIPVLPTLEDQTPLRNDNDSEENADGKKQVKDKKQKKRKRRSEIQWVQCNNCSKWRSVPGTVDMSIFPPKWYCYMNSWNTSLASCSAENPSETDALRLQHLSGDLPDTPTGGLSSPMPLELPSTAQSTALPPDFASHDDKKKRRTDLDKPPTKKQKKSKPEDSSEKAILTREGDAKLMPNTRPAAIETSPADGGSSDVETLQRPTTKGSKAVDSENIRDTTSSQTIVPSARGKGKKAVKTVWQWVQCEKCEKWRKLPQDVDASTLPDKWFCSMNEWDSARATCSAPQEDDSASSDHPPQKPAQVGSGKWGNTKKGNGKLSYRELIFGSNGLIKKTYTDDGLSREDGTVKHYRRDEQYRQSSMYTHPTKRKKTKSQNGKTHPSSEKELGFGALQHQDGSSWSKTEQRSRSLSPRSKQQDSGTILALRSSARPVIDEEKLAKIKEILLQKLDDRHLTRSELAVEVSCHPLVTSHDPTVTFSDVQTALQCLLEAGQLETVLIASESLIQTSQSIQRMEPDTEVRYRKARRSRSQGFVNRPLRFSKPWKQGKVLPEESTSNDGITMAPQSNERVR